MAYYTDVSKECEQGISHQWIVTEWLKVHPADQYGDKRECQFAKTLFCGRCHISMTGFQDTGW